MTRDEPLYTNRQRADSFGDDAEQYDRIRPTYPAVMVDDLMVGQPIRVLDVGCGTGIAARLFTERGCDVLGLEPDPRMAAVARRHGLVVEESSIEVWGAQGRLFDLLTAGQAWHWVEPRIGAVRAAEVLAPGGRIGLFWNQAQPAAAAAAALHKAYDRHAPELGAGSVLLGERDVSLYDSIADAFVANGHFADVRVARYEHEADYSTDAWLELSLTHSTHRVLATDIREPLFEALRDAVDGVGGHVPVRYETTLVTGRRQPG